MATVKELHYQFKINMDRIDSASNPDFKPWEIDWFLTEAQLMFIKQRMSSTSNPKRKGFEQSQKRIDDLGALVIKFPKQVGIVPTEVSPGIFELSVADFTFSYMYLVDGFVDATIGNCTRRVPLRFTQHDDYLNALKDPFYAGHEEFIPYNIGRGSSNGVESIYMYSSYPITMVYPEYIKMPAKVSIGSYKYLDGITYPEHTLETSAPTHTEIVDLACSIAAMAAQNPEYVQFRQAKLAMND